MPLIKVIDLTMMAFYINSAIDSGNYSNITLDFIRSKIESGEIFDFLHDEIHADLGLLTPDKKQELLWHWRSMNNAVAASDLLIERNGLCLLMAYLLEELQNGTGTPDDYPKR